MECRYCGRRVVLSDDGVMKRLIPSNWTEAGAISFYERHNCSVDLMKTTIEDWGTVDDPGAMAAAVADYVRGTTYWRGKLKQKGWYCDGCGKVLPKEELHEYEDNHYCAKCFVITRERDCKSLFGELSA